MIKIDKNINGNPLGSLFYILSTSTNSMLNLKFVTHNP